MKFNLSIWLLILSALSSSHALAQMCFEISNSASSNGSHCFNRQGQDFQLNYSENLFSPLSDSPYLDLKEQWQNEKIKRIYKNQDETKGPFVYCNDEYGCRFLKKNDADELDATERRKIEADVQSKNRHYAREKALMAESRQKASTVKSVADLPEGTPRRVYETKIAELTRNTNQQAYDAKQKTQKLKERNSSLKDTIIPSKIVERDTLNQDNKETLEVAQSQFLIEVDSLAQSVEALKSQLQNSTNSEDALFQAAKSLATNMSSGSILEADGPGIISNVSVADYARGYSFEGDPEQLNDQTEQVAAAYQAMGHKLKAERMRAIASTMNNFSNGHTLPYQATKLSGLARESFGVEFTADTFAGYESIRLFNQMARSPQLHSDEGFKNAAFFIGQSLMDNGGRDTGRTLRDLEIGWSLVDFVSGAADGLYSSVRDTLSGAVQIVLHPIDSVMALGSAIYNYDRTWTAMRTAVVEQYEVLKNCEGDATACGEVVGTVSGEILQTLVPVGAVAKGAKLTAGVRAASMAQAKVGTQLIRAAERIGIKDGPGLERFLKKVDELNPCGLALHTPARRGFEILGFDRRSFAKLLDVVLLSSVAYAADGRPCSGGGNDLVAAQKIAEGLAEVPGMNSGTFEVVLDSARKWDSVESLIHVAKGNYRVTAEGTRQLVSGMHTKLGFDNFLKLNQNAGRNFSIQNVTEFTAERIEAGGSILSQTLESGVRRLQLPRDAWVNGDAFNKAIAYTEAGQKVKGVKSLFPESWDVSKIAEAVDAVKNSPSSVVQGNSITGIFDSVKITMYIDSEGKILTSFPTWVQ